MRTEPAKLLTLLPAIESELSRWVLARYGLPHRESPHAPVFHALALKFHGLGGSDYPALFPSGGAAIATTPAIVAHYDPLMPVERRLVPEADAAAIHQHFTCFHDTLRTPVVNWVYWTLLPHRDLTRASFTTGVPWIEKVGVALLYPLVRAAMIKGLGLSAAAAAQGLDTIRRTFDTQAAAMADGRPYVMGDRLTLADYAFACMGAPALLEPRYGGHLPSIDAVPPAMGAAVRELRDHPTGRFIQRLYDERAAAPATSR